VRYREYTGEASYYPYGEEETPTGNDTQKFATYTRDSATGLDYAQNRYYASQIGRFTTADPYQASGGPEDPQGWNRYAYVGNDPVNFHDPTGLLMAVPGEGGNGGGGGDLVAFPLGDFGDVDSCVSIMSAMYSSLGFGPGGAFGMFCGGGHVGSVAASGPRSRNVGPPSGAQFDGFFMAYHALLDKPGCASLIAGSSGASTDALQTDLWNADVTVGTSQPGNGPVTFDTSVVSHK
jgi:RHS repeat-associated protein